ncbi:hypothetical protein BAE44_0004523 [Dichanthelium oligosanthes]|uniref:Uncharacterized protein n=1 Tax=Dichanthelium oligosanthes TaxID=888268 RepID=A0A1E5WAK3_9POAL|nr:hypothetical protein BAE44_0004523 [Dichanthelium oligosanthes]
MGRDTSKAAKKASSSWSETPSVGQEFTSLLSNMHIEKMSVFTKSDDTVSLHLTKLLEVEREKVALGKAQHEEKIMAMDLSMCNPAQRAVYAAWQAEIASRVVPRPPNPTNTP